MSVVMKHIQNDTTRRAVMVLSVVMMPLMILLMALNEALKKFWDEFTDGGRYWGSKGYRRDFKDCWKESAPGDWWE